PARPGPRARRCRRAPADRDARRRHARRRERDERPHERCLRVPDARPQLLSVPRLVPLKGHAMTRMLLLATLLAACGDNGKAPPMSPDGSQDTTPAAPRAVVVAGDFVSPGFAGVMSSLDITTMTMTTNVAPAGAIGSDPVLRKLGNELFVVNRFGGNNVTILDANSLTVKEQ